MKEETLNRANQIQSQMTIIKGMLSRIEKNPALEITFNNGSWGCCSNQSDYLTDEEVADIKADLTKRIRERAQARLAELQKEFDNL